MWKSYCCRSFLVKQKTPLSILGRHPPPVSPGLGDIVVCSNGVFFCLSQVKLIDKNPWWCPWRCLKAVPPPPLTAVPYPRAEHPRSFYVKYTSLNSFIDACSADSQSSSRIARSKWCTERFCRMGIGVSIPRSTCRSMFQSRASKLVTATRHDIHCHSRLISYGVLVASHALTAAAGSQKRF